MIGKNFIEEDLELKRLVTSAPEDRPRFDWSNVARNQTTNGLADSQSTDNPAEGHFASASLSTEKQRHMETADIADMIGEAVTDFMLSRQEDAIFTDQNQNLVSEIARVVSLELNARHTESDAGAGTF